MDRALVLGFMERMGANGEARARLDAMAAHLLHVVTNSNEDCTMEDIISYQAMLEEEIPALQNIVIEERLNNFCNELTDQELAMIVTMTNIWNQEHYREMMRKYEKAGALEAEPLKVAIAAAHARAGARISNSV